MTLLETLRALAPVVTPGEWAYRPDEYDDWGLVKTEPREVGNYEPPFILRGVIGQFRDPDVSGEEALNQHRKAGTDPWESNARLIVTLRNNLPTIIAALKVAELVRDEDWLAGIIKQSDDDLLSGEPEYLARAIIAALPKESDNG
jgi:hypothetical protein